MKGDKDDATQAGDKEGEGVEGVEGVEDDGTQGGVVTTLSCRLASWPPYFRLTTHDFGLTADS
jgi:hypothetical protein